MTSMRNLFTAAAFATAAMLPGLHALAQGAPDGLSKVEKLYADQEGMHVHEGDPLFELYSPELQVAAEELLGAVRAQRAQGRRRKRCHSDRRRTRQWTTRRPMRTMRHLPKSMTRHLSKMRHWGA